MTLTNPLEAGLDGPRKLLLVITERDIVFHCPSCQGELVVDRDGSGLEVSCSHCGNTLVVPPYQPRASSEQPAVTLLTPVSDAPAAVVSSRKFDVSGLTPEQVERRLGELKHQLKENRSQDTEMRGHVNRANMELHRLQLRLKKLQERHADIEAELAELESLGGDGIKQDPVV